jgi:two-component system, sensor histidine kinase and response regulator
MEQVPKALAYLEEIGGDSLVQELIAMFQDDAPRRLIEAKTAAEAADVVTARRAVHTLRSTSAQLGLASLSALCAQLEALAQVNDLRSFLQRLPEVEALSTAGIAELLRVGSAAAH